MAAVQVCKHFKFGHCRFQDKCRHEHVFEVCEDTNCNIFSCRKRHPRSCIFFKEFKRCKFGSFCNYKHEMEFNACSRSSQLQQQHQDEMSSLMSKIKCLEDTIINLVNENNSLKQKIEVIEVEVQVLMETPAKPDSSEALQVMERGVQTDNNLLFECEEIVKNGDYFRSSRVDGPGGLAYGSFPSWSFKTP